MNEQLVNYFKEGLSRGISIQKLKISLVEAEWPEEKVDEVVNLFEEKRISKLDSSVKKNLLKKRPVGVWIVSILHWLIAAIIVISSLISYFSVKNQLDFLGSFMGGFASSGTSALVLIFPFLISLIPIFVGLAIFKGKKDARILAIVIGLLGSLLLIYSLFSLFDLSSLLNLILALVVLFFLLIDKKTRAYFKK